MPKEVRNGKKINFKKIYIQIAKQGNKTILEMAEEYGMEEEEFRERIEKGMSSDLYREVIKANDEVIKSRKNGRERKKVTAVETETETHEEEKDVATKRTRKGSTVTMTDLETKRASYSEEISEKEELLEEAKDILTIRQETLSEAQAIFDKAQEALKEAKSEVRSAESNVNHCTKDIQKLKDAIAKIEEQMTELRKKAMYLVAPGFTGKKPEYGTYVSTVSVEGFELTVIEPSADSMIKPDIQDMFDAEYDFVTEYKMHLKFVSLCMEYMCKDIEYEVLVEDERLKKLLQKHIG